jgi:hypothetical protein
MNCSGTFSPSLYMRDLAISHFAWGVISQFANFISHLSSVLFQTILLIFRVTQFTAVFHAGPMVSCHNFLGFLLCFNRWGRPGVSYFQSKIVSLLDNSLNAEAIVAAKSCSVLSSSLEKWFQIFGNMSSEARLRNSSQSGSFPEDCCCFCCDSCCWLNYE